jgi:NAD(P)-dependent dehydrogenase (short-subunit alcohol dehydrogenase family)
VAVLARSAQSAEGTASLIRACGRRAIAIGAQVASWAAVEQAVAELSVADLQRTFAVNVLGPLHAMRAVLPGISERRSGVVVDLSSGGRGQAVRCMAPARPRSTS